MRVLTLVVVGVAAVVAGCGGRGVGSLAGEGIDQVVITRAGASDEATPIVVTHAECIRDLAKAVEEAERDSTQYPAAARTVVDFRKGGESVCTVQVAGSLLEFDERQYRDATGVLARLVGGMLSAGAALTGAATLDSRSASLGDKLQVSYTVRNVGSSTVKLVGTLLLEVDWSVGAEQSAANGSIEEWEAETSQEVTVPLDAGGDVPLEAGSFHTYAFAVPTDRMPAGPLRLRITFSFPQPPADEETRVPPPIIGLDVTLR